MTKIRWPWVFYLRRCSAWFYEVPINKCNKILWPWQNAVEPFDPECGGVLQHHACHHREIETLYTIDDEDGNWKENLNCEHRTRD